jgi:predicted permease
MAIDSFVRMFTRWFDDLWADVRYGSRMLTKAPGFTAVAVLTLALGIGVNATVFSYVNALLLRPPGGVSQMGGLEEVWLQNTKAAGVERFLPLNYPDYVYYRDHNKVFSGMAVFDGDPEQVIWNRAGNGEPVMGQIVSGNFFSVIGVRAAVGRTLSPEDDHVAESQPVTMLSYSFWQTRLGADPNVVGKRLVLNGTECRVVGVAPAGFEGLEIAIEPDFWVPAAMVEHIKRDTSFLTSRQTYWLSGVGRLNTGVGVPEARADLSVLAQQIEKQNPDAERNIDTAIFPVTLVPGPFRGYVGAFTGLLMAVVGLVLLIACTNAANLMLMRAVGRRREMAIRSALGAGRGRLIRQILVESTLLAAIAGCAGLLLAYWTAPLLLSLKPASLPIRIEVPTDWRVVVFTIFASLATGIVFGLAPALRSAKTDLTPALKYESSGGAYQKSRLRGTLVIAQMATCAVLLVGAVLCVRSLMNAQSIDPGFDIRHVAMAELDIGSVGYTEAKGRDFDEKLVESVRNLPGVTAASWVSHLPLGTSRETRSASAFQATPEGYAESAPKAKKNKESLDVFQVGARYFETMGIPLDRGRDFTAEESKSSQKVTVINETAARLFWPSQDAVGQQLQLGKQDAYQVIGVVKTGKYRTLGEDALPAAYLPIGYAARATLVARTKNDPRSLIEPIRREIQAIDANVAPTDLETMQQYMTLPLFPARVTGILLGVFGMLALVLAMGGLYGVIAYTTSQRTREIGLRMALGAQQKDIVRLVLKHGLTMTGIGLAAGIAAAFGVTRVLSSLLYGIRADDPATLIGVSCTLISVALLACYVPARRAMRVDPMVALRYE